MRREKLFITIAFVSLLIIFSGCSTAPPETVTPTDIPTITSAVTLTATTAPTSTPPPSPTYTPTPTATPTPSPTPTNTPAPTATPTPSPTPTNTPTPTVTPTPSPTPTNTPTPTPALPTGFPEITYKENVILKETVLTSEEEANRYLFDMALQGCYSFGILVEDISMLHTEEEYLELFPEIHTLKVESLTKYHNGYYLRFSDLKTTHLNLAYQYALRTGDTYFLTDNEKETCNRLHSIAKELNLQELSDIDAIIAAHDYLVLNTAYDEETAKRGTGGISHLAEGALLHGSAVCSGYATAFQLLMYMADINCEYVWNDTHAWNLVQLEDEWYHIDVTWDDPVPDQPGVVLYTHFMMTDEEVSQLENHQNWSCECGEPHDCDDESYRISPYNDYLCTTEEEAVALIHAQADSEIITLLYPCNGLLTEGTLIQLTFQTLGLSDELTYYPSDLLGSSHYLLRIKTRKD